MAVSKQKKVELLQELVDLFARSKSVVFTEYKGIGVHPMSDLRRKLRKENAECKVGKKTLMRLAAKKNSFPEFEDNLLSGQLAATFVYDEGFGAFKVLYKFAKENEKLKILGGVMEGKVVSADVIKQYAMIPSKEELLAKMLGSLMSPLSAFARALKAIGDKLAAGAPKAEAPAAAPAAPAAAPVAPATPAV
jgi:large subunit ribosomal protein L10